MQSFYKTLLKKWQRKFKHHVVEKWNRLLKIWMSSWIRYHLLACLVCSFKFGTNTTKHFTFLPIGDILKFSTRLGKVDMPPMTKYWALQSYLMTSWLWITWAGLHFIYLIPWSFHLPDQPCSADLDLLICVNTWGSNLLAQTLRKGKDVMDDMNVHKSLLHLESKFDWGWGEGRLASMRLHQCL